VSFPLPPSGSSQLVSLTLLTSQPYLNAALMEATRLYPPIIALTRTSMTDTVLPTSPASDGEPSENVFIPRGSEVLIHLAALHRYRK
jgi:cytochrome P450